MGFLLRTVGGAQDDWKFFSMASNQPIYVVLTPPGGPVGSVPLPLAGLPAEHLEELRKLQRGDRVPPRIAAALLALAPRSAFKPPLVSPR